MTALSELEAVLDDLDAVGIRIHTVKNEDTTESAALLFLLRNADLLRQRLVEAEPVCWRYKLYDDLYKDGYMWCYTSQPHRDTCVPLYAAPPNTPDKQGYVDAFYKISELLNMPAMALSPEQAFVSYIYPKLQALMKRPTFDEARACVPDRLGPGHLTEDERGWNDAVTETLRNIDERERRG